MCRVTSVLSYSWKGGDESNTQYGSRLDTIVTLTLAKVDGGTRLRLVHSGFVTPKNDIAFTNMSGGWKKVVGRIGAVSGEHQRTEGGRVHGRYSAQSRDQIVVAG